MSADKIAAALKRPFPAFILDKRAVYTQVHRHQSAAAQALRYELFRHCHIRRCAAGSKYRLAIFSEFVSLCAHHEADCFFIIICCFMARPAALEKTVISLSVKSLPLSKPAF